MRRLASLAALGFLALSIGGCPIFSDNDDGYCGDGRCYDDDYCDSPSDCASDEVCGADHECHIGQCDVWGCPSGFQCDVKAIDLFECIDNSTTSTGTGAGGDGGGGGGGGDTVYCGNPDDCEADETCGTDGTCQAGDCSDIECIYGFVCDETGSTPVCVHANPAGCGADTDCTGLGTGYRCVSGECTAPADQCFDQTQCLTGDVCADGKCIPSCEGGSACPSSYSCDAVDLCTVPETACVITNDCGGPAHVCVDGACVPRSFDGICLPDEVWVENGCIPDQSALFVCAVDGEQDACAAGSICLHHSCYISCAPPNEAVCTSLPEFNECKPVTTQNGTYPVCGSDSNLGGECDPTAGISCDPGLVCIDGFCN